MTSTRCRVCHRVLLDPRHAAAGIGPKCASRLGLEFKKPPRKVRVRAEKPAPRAQNVTAPMLPFEELPQDHQ